MNNTITEAAVAAKIVKAYPRKNRADVEEFLAPYINGELDAPYGLTEDGLWMLVAQAIGYPADCIESIGTLYEQPDLDAIEEILHDDRANECYNTLKRDMWGLVIPRRGW